MIDRLEEAVLGLSPFESLSEHGMNIVPPVQYMVLN